MGTRSECKPSIGSGLIGFSFFSSSYISWRVASLFRKNKCSVVDVPQSLRWSVGIVSGGERRMLLLWPKWWFDERGMNALVDTRAQSTTAINRWAQWIVNIVAKTARRIGMIFVAPTGIFQKIYFLEICKQARRWEFSRNVLEDWLIMVIIVPATELVLYTPKYCTYIRCNLFRWLFFCSGFLNSAAFFFVIVSGHG